MKRETIHITLGRPRNRVHVALFGDTPFKPKKVELKTRYKRKAKHPKRVDSLY